MENEDKKIEQEEEKKDILDEIKEIKMSSVPKAEYEKMKKERDDAYRKIMNGDFSQEDQKTPPVDINAIRQELFGKNRKDMTNLDFIKKSLALRNALIEKGEADPFLGKLVDGVPSEQDKERMDNVAQFLQQLVIDSGDDPDAFRALMQARLVDSKRPR